jgi:long-chain acyl-CoA synthetase
LDADGYLSITGRKKDVIITAGGKNLTPANLENDLRRCR